MVTALLFVEILFRFISDWRNFHRSKRNWVDLALAVVTTVIQLPPIRRSGQVYAWFTVFQVMRIYRVVLAVSVTRDLLVSRPSSLESTSDKTDVHRFLYSAT